LRRKTVAVALLAMATSLVMVPAAAPADEAQIDGHVHGDLEELSGFHLHGSDAHTVRQVALFGATFFNESAGCGEPRGVLPPLTTTDSTSNRSIPSDHQVRGPWGNFFGRDYGDVSGSMVSWTIPMSGGKTTRVHERALPAFERVAANLAVEAAKGRHYEVRIAGGWVWRRIGGLYRMSTHSFGTTIDINWDTNPYRSDNTLVTDMPGWFIDAWREAGFCWGGDWQTIKDPMHFSWQGPLATPGYGTLPKPFDPVTRPSDYGSVETSLKSTFGSLDRATHYTFYDGNADAAPDVFRVEPWGDDDLLVSFARSSRDFSHCGVSSAVFQGGAHRGAEILVADHAGTARADVWVIQDGGARLRITVGRYADAYSEPIVLTPGIRSPERGTYLAGDHDRDGVPDLFVIDRGPETRVDVYDGATGFTSKIYGATLSLGDTTDEARWRFDLSDHDLDGRADLAVVDVGDSVRLRVYAGADRLRTRLLNQVTAAPARTRGVYEMEDWDGDGRGDLMMMTPAGGVRVYLGGVQDESDTFWFQEPDWTCGSSGSDVPWDLDGDRIADLPMGIPGEDVGGVRDAGAVDVLYGTKAGPTTRGAQRWHQDVGSLGSPVEAGDVFGSAMTSGDFDGDGYGDLAVGAPGDGVGSVDAAGVVNVIPGGTNGLTDVDSLLLHRDVDGIPGVARPRARFGSALASGDFNGDGWDDLAVGAPKDRVVYSAAGSVSVLYGGKSGLAAKGSQVWSQNAAGVRGAAGRGDWFGAALAVGDFNGDGYDDLAVGAPRDDQADARRAGEVNVLFGSSRGLTADGNQRFSKAHSAIGGVPQRGDRFGTALAAGDFDGDGFDELAIGVPGERSSGRWHAGALHVLGGAASGLVARASVTWHADTPGVPGTADRGDKLGASLAVGDFDRDGFDDLAIGHPDESIPSATETGAVTVLYGSSSRLTASNADLWLQGHDGLPASPESNDHFGEFLRVADLDGDDHDDLVIGMPSEDLEVSGAGVVMVIYAESGGLQSGGAQIWYEEYPGLSGVATAGDGLGRL
jgi:hypothetical protein